MKMWKSDNSFWLAVGGWLKACWPTIYGAALAVLIAYARIIYDGVERKNKWLEAFLCGALSLAVTSILNNYDLAPFVGGMIGFIGVDKLREFAIKFLNKKAGGSNDV